MLSFFVYVVSLLLLFAYLYGQTLAFVWRSRDKWLAYLLYIATAIGFVAGTGVYIAKRLQPKKLLRLLTTLNRHVIVLAWLFALIGFVLLIIYLLVKQTKLKFRLDSGLKQLALAFFSLSIIPLQMHLIPQLLLKTGEFVAFNEESISTGTLFRFLGYGLGLLLVFLTGLSVFHACKRMLDKHLYLIAVLNYAAIVLHLSVRGVSSGARLGIFSSRNNFIFDIMILEDKCLPYFAISYLLLAVVTALAVYLTHRKLVGTFKTAAMRRKEAWWQRNCRRWAKSLVIFMLLSALTLTVVNDYITRPVKLTAPEEYQDENRQIIVDLKQVEDGHLHRFAYEFEHHNIRFIVVRKPKSNAYGVGLDACNICGIAGYFERGDSVVCKRCDVVMNKATIGFLGGCNPVPFPYVVKDGKIIINKADLEKEANRFPLGA